MSVGQLFLTRKSDLPYRLFQSSSSSSASASASRCDAGRRVRPKQPTHAHTHTDLSSLPDLQLRLRREGRAGDCKCNPLIDATACLLLKLQVNGSVKDYT